MWATYIAHSTQREREKEREREMPLYFPTDCDLYLEEAAFVYILLKLLYFKYYYYQKNTRILKFSYYQII